MPVAELQRRMSSTEFVEWMAYEQLEGPLGEGREDWRAGLIASTIANVNRKKSAKAFKPTDFIPDWSHGAPKVQKPQLPPAEVADKVRNWLQSLASRAKR